MPLKIITNKLDCNRTLKNRMKGHGDEKHAPGIFWYEDGKQNCFKVPRRFTGNDVQFIAAAIYSIVNRADENAEKYLRHTLEKEEQYGASMVGVAVDTYSDDEEVNRQALNILVSRVVEWSSLPIVIYSTTLATVKSAVRIARRADRPCHITATENNINDVLKFAGETGASLFMVPVDWDHLTTNDERIDTMRIMIEKAFSCGFSPKQIMLDIKLHPLASNTRVATDSLSLCRKIRAQFGMDIDLCAHIPSISQGLPEAAVINNCYLKMLEEAGLNCPIIDPLGVRPQNVFPADLWEAAQNAILGKDEFAMDYINLVRQRGRI